jgi:LysM repeat protein
MDGTPMKILRPRLSALLAILLSAAFASAVGAFAEEEATAPATDTATPGQVTLNPQHPERYVVKKGDTLWDISAMFLRDPWFWPEIWQVNPQIRNPHLIYPGDVLTLAYDGSGKPQLQLERGPAGAAAEARFESGGGGRLSPAIREQDLAEAIPAIPLSAIGAFLSRGQVLEKKEINKLPHIVAIRENHLIGAAGNDLYVRGKTGAVQQGYSVIHIGDALKDPEDGDVVGYQGLFVGEGTISRAGNPATLFLNDTSREALKGDRLISQTVTFPASFSPHAPSKPIKGRIIAVIDGVKNVAQYQVVVLNRGSRDGIEPGHVLRVWRTTGSVRDTYGSDWIPPKVRLPDEQAGVSMVFRTYDRISYALIMEAKGAIHVNDKVLSPT